MIIIKPILKDHEPFVIDPLNKHILFIFPDNILDIYCADGPGPRIYNKYGAYKDHPLSAGIPVAWDPWEPTDYFEDFTMEVKQHIDRAFQDIRDLISKYGYTTLAFRAKEVDVDDKNPRFNAGDAPRSVEKYITKLLCSLRS